MLNGKAKFLLSLTVGLLVMGISAVAFAQGDTGVAESLEAVELKAKAWKAIAGALGIAIAAFGGALGQSRAASAALGGIARNPGAQDKVFVPMLLGLAFIESLVIFTLIISFMALG